MFDLQDEAYRESVMSVADRWDAMAISNRSLRVTRDWVENSIVAEYSMTSDWDDRWRTGGAVDEIIAEVLSSRAKRQLRVSVQPFFASEYFVPRLSEVTAGNPEIDIQVSASDESAESHPADADLSIRLFRSPPKGVQSRLLFPMRLVPAGSSALADARVPHTLRKGQPGEDRWRHGYA